MTPRLIGYKMKILKNTVDLITNWLMIALIIGIISGGVVIYLVMK